jgi:hypothetical protein
VEWTMATGALPTSGLGAVAPITTNGSSFLGVARNLGVLNSNLGDDRTMVRSVDGITWEGVASPIELVDEGASPIAAGTQYLLESSYADKNDCQNGGSPKCSVQISADGLTWDSEPSATMGDEILGGWMWRVESADSVLLSNPPPLFGVFWPFESIVMEFDDRLVALGIHHGTDHTLGAFESTEPGSWTQVDPPLPFADVMTREYLEAGLGSMWSCEFAARDGQGMALIARQDKYELWNTNDGIMWRRLPDPPTQPEAAGRGRCIKAVDDGWVIGPGGHPGGIDDFFDTPHVMGTPGSLIFSEDGAEWRSLEHAPSVSGFTGRLETAGNNIYIINQDTGDILVGVINPE